MSEHRPAEAAVALAVQNNTATLAGARLRALAAMGASDLARARARAARQRAVSALPASLAMFEAAAARNGTVVHRAPDARAAVRVVEGLLARRRARHVVKSKSMVTEEIRLREHLERAGREVVETDLGEWLVQLAGETPSHIIIPAVHLPRQRIRELLSDVAGRDLGPRTPDLAAFARQHLRQRFLRADAGISGANLLIAETGTLMIVSNEGNARMCTTLPRLHIAVVGVEKVVRTWSEALDVLAVLPRSATGQDITQYVSFLSGPRRTADPRDDGPDELHVVLLDNGRSRLVGTPSEELLYCIRCGACLNVCPVYRTMGGHAYGSVYPGPIGAALTPRLTRGRAGRDLPWASSLCGACREACPVGIALDDQLIALRAEHPGPAGERVVMATFAAFAGRPASFRAALRVARVVLGGRLLERLPGRLDGWTRSRSLRSLAPLRRRYRREQAAGLLAAAPAAEIPVAPAASPPPDGDVVERFAAKWRAQGGQATVLERAHLADTLRELTAEGPVSVDAVLAGLVEGVALAGPAEAVAGVVWAEAASAETGTVVLRSGEHTERRRSLLPPRLVVVVDADMVHADLGTAFGALGLVAPAGAPAAADADPPQPPQPPAAVTLISGPSRSSDIENDLVIGVHGPGDAWALIVRG